MNKIRDREITVGQPDLKTAFYDLTVLMENEMVSKTFAELLLKTIERVYQENQTRKSREMLGIMERRVDSLARVLNRTESGAVLPERPLSIPKLWPQRQK